MQALLNPEQLARYWPLDPEITFLNHGSFGSTPWPVLHAQSEWRARMERDPVQFLDSSWRATWITPAAGSASSWARMRPTWRSCPTPRPA